MLMTDPFLGDFACSGIDLSTWLAMCSGHTKILPSDTLDMYDTIPFVSDLGFSTAKALTHAPILVIPMYLL